MTERRGEGSDELVDGRQDFVLIARTAGRGASDERRQKRRGATRGAPHVGRAKDAVTRPFDESRQRGDQGLDVLERVTLAALALDEIREPTRRSDRFERAPETEDH